MELEFFIANVAALFDETDVNELTGHTEFRSLEGWSSLVALGLMAMVDENYDVKIKGEDIKSANTISDLYEIVKYRR